MKDKLTFVNERYITVGTNWNPLTLIFHVLSIFNFKFDIRLKIMVLMISLEWRTFFMSMLSLIAQVNLRITILWPMKEVGAHPSYIMYLSLGQILIVTAPTGHSPIPSWRSNLHNLAQGKMKDLPRVPFNCQRRGNRELTWAIKDHIDRKNIRHL